MSAFKKMIPMIALAGAALAPSLSMGATPWKITKESWTAVDEREYSEWIQKIGESGCSKVNNCLKSPANYLATSAEKATYSFEADCGRFPYLLRAYFAWKRGLPFSVVSDVKTAPDDGGRGFRYAANGYLPKKRTDFVGSEDGAAAVKKAASLVNTAMYRMDPNLDIESGNLFSDHYSVKIDRQSLRPGTLVYDPAGHVAVVYKVEDHGEILMMDAHPGSSVSHITYDKAFERSRPTQGAGFKNFRPLKVSNGRVVTISNKNLADYGIEQFYGTNPVAGSWSKGTFEVKGKPMKDYYEFVKARMSVGDLKFDPILELTRGIEVLCDTTKYRIQAVQEAIDAGIHNKSQPSKLPSNIYGTDGEWEEYSSPSRDARLRTSFYGLRTKIQDYVELYRNRDPRVVYSGQNLGADLRTAYDQAAKACVIEYKRSDNSTMTLEFDEVVRRLFALSFDPYQCPELRWGATGGELSTCKDGATKRAWYAAEQRLRNQIERKYDAKMDFDLNQLQSKAPNSGVDQAPDVDLRAYLNSI